jgi:hypothetical protein
MRLTIIPLTALCLILGMGIWADPVLSQQIGQRESSISNKELCGLMIRKGKESFSRNRFSEAKDYFRRAVSADPSSQDAWSNYDLALIYSVAEQFRNHGTVVSSTAPAPEPSTAQPPGKMEGTGEPPAAQTAPPQVSSPGTSPPAPPAQTRPAVPKFTIKDDEGC